jgi:hypothetical protein
VTALALPTATPETATGPLSVFHDLADWCEELAAAATAVRFPTSRWAQDPVGFSHEVLGATPWWRQVEILEAVRDHDRVTVRSGHKVGKSNTAALLALWFYCSFEDARVLLTSTTARQVEDILWRELKKVRARGFRATGHRIDPEPHELARSGMKSDDFRQILGFTAKQPEAVAGVSGANLLYIVDEASGVPDVIFEAIEGNRAGGVNARLVLFSNPTKTSGEFYRSHSREKRDLYKAIVVSSEETPNCTGGTPIPGLASPGWVAEKEREWGRSSALFKVRVLGEFASESSNAVLPLSLVDAAVSVWESAVGEGRLHVGVDVARSGSDESIVAIRRGFKVLGLHVVQLPPGAHASPQWASMFCEAVLAIIDEYRHPREQRPLVKIDAIGVGEPVFQTLFAVQRFSALVEAVSVTAYDYAPRSLADRYERVRDCLWFGLRDWMREGGALPDDNKLQAELVAPDTIIIASGRQKVTSKDEIRDALGRSPDRADAVALSVWNPILFEPPTDNENDPPPPARAEGEAVTYWQPPTDDAGDDSIDPYGGGIDAYGDQGGYR